MVLDVPRESPVKKNDEAHEHAMIVRSMRNEEGRPTHNLVENLGRMRTEGDWEWSPSLRLWKRRKRWR